MPTNTHPLIADYDDNYDYRTHWNNRAYEQWAEDYALERCLDRVKQTPWLIDFGGGFGRNVKHYRQRSEHAVLVDYSLVNLENAAAQHAEEIESGYLSLIRADLYRLPFIDRAFETGIIIRVLHHLAEVDNAIKEMGRVIGKQWLLDIPIKHHMLARLRALTRGTWHQLSTNEPEVVGSGEVPFVSFQLSEIRRLLAENEWDTNIVASVNNFRRWDQRLPKGAVTILKPAVYGLELGLQQTGKGWWGPSQFAWAMRREASPAQDSAVVPPDGPPLAKKLVCSACHQPLSWSSSEAHCTSCPQVFAKKGVIWDFVPQ